MTLGLTDNAGDTKRERGSDEVEAEGRHCWRHDTPRHRRVGYRNDNRSAVVHMCIGSFGWLACLLSGRRKIWTKGIRVGGGSVECLGSGVALEGNGVCLAKCRS